MKLRKAFLSVVNPEMGKSIRASAIFLSLLNDSNDLIVVMIEPVVNNLGKLLFNIGLTDTNIEGMTIIKTWIFVNLMNVSGELTEP